MQSRGQHGPIRDHCNIGGGMAHFHRLICFAFLLFFHLHSMAIDMGPDRFIPPIERWSSDHTPGRESNARSGAISMACGELTRQYAGAWGGYGATACPFDGDNFLSYCTNQCGGGVKVNLQLRYLGVGCPLGSALSEQGQCFCQGATRPNKAGNMCEATSVVDLLNRSKIPLVGTGKPSLTACYQGVVVKGSGAAGGVKAGAATTFEIYGPFTSDNTPCDPATFNGGNAKEPDQAATPTPASCASSGGYWGSVNGVDVCVPAKTNGTNVKADGVTESTQTTNNPDGSTTKTTKTTSCTDGKCSTTVKEETTDTGGTTTTKTKTEDGNQTDFCQNNPSSPICKPSDLCSANPNLSICKTSSFSGADCSGPPSCDGDAIQCGIAAAAWKTACALDTGGARSSTEQSTYDAAKSATGDQTTGSGINTEFTISASSFDTSDALGGAAGLSDLSITVMGRAVSLPLSGLNTWFNVLGYIAVACTGIYCMRIVARG